MSKYLIEFEEKPSYTEEGHKFYRCKQATWWSVSDSIINQLKPFDEDLAENETYGKGFNEGFNKGLVEAWELAEKLVLNTSPNEANRMGFDVEFATNEILEDYDVFLAREKVRAYSEMQANVKVGDEVAGEVLDQTTGIVTRISTDGLYVMWNDGSCGICEKDTVHKTGRHFPMFEELLKAMK